MNKFEELKQFSSNQFRRLTGVKKDSLRTINEQAIKYDET